MPLPLINFRKLITGNEEWAFTTIPKEENRGLTLSQPSTSIAKPNIHTKKILVYKGKGIELICTANNLYYYFLNYRIYLLIL